MYWPSVALCMFSLIIGLTNSVSGEARFGQTVTINSDETIDDDLYIVADSIQIEGTINGDLVASGRRITVSGTVNSDLIAAGQIITISGKVGDDVRIAGQNLSVESNGEIVDDLVASGFSLECQDKSRIGGEVSFFGYQSVYAGSIEKLVQNETRNCLLSGTFGSDVKISVDGSEYQPPFSFTDAPVAALPPGITVAGTANIAGDLEYRARNKAAVDEGAQIAGEVTFDQQAEEPKTLANRLMDSGRYLIALSLVGVLMVTFFPAWTNHVSDNIRLRPWGSLGWGLVCLIAVPLVAILLLAFTILVAVLLGWVSLDSLISTWLATGLLFTGVLTAGFAIFAVWGSKVVVGLWVGKRILRGEERSRTKTCLALVVGLGLLVALGAVPGIGRFFSLACTLLGLGAATIWMLRQRGVNHLKPAK